MGAMKTTSPQVALVTGASSGIGKATTPTLAAAGFVPNPFMANYVATKHAVEGYSESLDHEVREHGVRVLRVQPGPVNTPFDANQVQADTPLAVYAHRRRVFEDVMRESMRGGD